MICRSFGPEAIRARSLRADAICASDYFCERLNVAGSAWKGIEQNTHGENFERGRVIFCSGYVEIYIYNNHM